MKMPHMVAIKQKFPADKVADVPVTVRKALARLGLAARVRPGERVAITVGSRGIANIVTILETIIDLLLDLRAAPILVGCMGSHGGGTGEGMLEVLCGLGITQDRLRVPILVSDKVILLGTTSTGLPVYCAEEIAMADRIIVVNRVKPHTSFRGEHESGLLKMVAVGVGRLPGAETVHALGSAGMAQGILDIATTVLSKLPVLGAVGIVENGYEETARIEGFLPEEIVTGDGNLLAEAKELLPGLPIERLDFLLVQEMGKNFSGTGMDVNVTGRWGLEDSSDPDVPCVRRLAVLDLSDASSGNANGIGLADFTTRKLFNKINFQATYLNGLTTNLLARIKIPIVLENDQEVWEKGLASLRSNLDPRVVIIKNTLELEQMLVSETLVKELHGREDVEIGKDIGLISFDNDGTLVKIVE